MAATAVVGATAIAVLIHNRGRPSTRYTITPTTNAPMPPRDNVKYNVTPSIGTAAAATTRTTARSRRSLERWTQSTIPNAENNPKAFQ